MSTPEAMDFSGYKIYNPDTVPFVERDDFIKGLEKLTAVIEPPPLEEAVLRARNEMKVSEEVARLARDYVHYRDEGARLPKFSRWVSSMYPSNKELSNVLASVGQVKATAGNLVFSAACRDLLRAGTGPHLGSCFYYGGGAGDKSLLAIAATAPGIGVAYTDASDGHMQGRWWLYHGVRESDNADVVVLPSRAYGRLPLESVVDALKAGGYIVYKALGYDRATGKEENVSYVNMGQPLCNDVTL